MIRAVLAMALGFVTLAQAQDLPPVRFGLGPFLPAEHLEREFAPLLAHLGQVTGRRFVPVIGTT